MKSNSFANFLWGKNAQVSFLLVAALLLLFTGLGDKEIWTQEHRWADIVTTMFYRHDFIHPYLDNNQYYDKPLLSYWLIVLSSLCAGGLTALTLRLPSALSAMLAIYCLYLLGSKLKNKQLGLLSAWMMLTTYYFLFWARTSSADMLNVSGSLLAVTWYFYRAERASFFDYSVFYVILAITSLCKGLVGSIVPLLAVFTDMCLRKTLRYHLNLKMFLAITPGVVLYLLPFMISGYVDTQGYGQNGLYLVYRENFLRYFQPFDHRGPFYTYFLYLPIYLLPWTVFLFPALFSIFSRYKNMNLSSKWIMWTLCILFLFFTLSGSRRSYYVLPMVPFAILLIVDWLLAVSNGRVCVWASRILVFSLLFLMLTVDIIPVWYYSSCGANHFASVLKADVEKIKPWDTWRIVVLDAESKVFFYLHVPAETVSSFDINGKRHQQTAETLTNAWPILKNKPKNTIFITRKLYEPLLKPYFVGYHIVSTAPSLKLFKLLDNKKDDASIAFVPDPHSPDSSLD